MENKFLKKITAIADSISNGDLNIKTKFTLKEKKDNQSLVESIEKIIGSLKKSLSPDEHEKELKAEIEKYRNYLNSIPAPVHVVDKRYNVQFINRRGAELVNMEPGECIGQKCYDLFLTPHCRTEKCAVKRALLENNEITAENIIDPKGINIPIQYTGVPFRDNKGKIIGALEHITDISDLKRIMDDLELQKSYLDKLPSMVHIVDNEYNIQYINRSGAETFGMSQEECKNKKCYDIFKTPHCKTSECRMHQAFIEDKTATGENTADPRGLNIPIQYTAMPIKDKNGKIIGGLEQVSDITELKNTMNKVNLQTWLQNGLSQLNDKMRGDQDITALSNNIITSISKYLKASLGTFYIVSEEDPSKLKLTGSYAFTQAVNSEIELVKGEGLVGQAAIDEEIISITDVPEGYLKVKSSLGNINSQNILIVPFKFEGDLKGVFEIASLDKFAEKEMIFIKSATENIGIAVNSAVQRVKMKQLLEETQAQSEELQAQTEELRAQEEELRASNEELEGKNIALQKAEEQLKEQQAEIEASLEELEEKTNQFEREKAERTRNK